MQSVQPKNALLCAYCFVIFNKWFSALSKVDETFYCAYLFIHSLYNQTT